MTRGIVVLTLTLAIAASAHAAPGDPRLIQGTLEWPAKLTAEPFVVVRTEDGRWYYAEIKSAKRLEATQLVAGTRVAVLGAEAARPHEITAIAIGSGDAAALAMALMPHVNPAAASTAASPAAAVASPAAAEVAKPESSQAQKPVAKSEPAAKPESAAKAESPAKPDAAGKSEPGKPESGAKSEPASSAPAKTPQPPVSDSTPSDNSQVTVPAKSAPLATTVWAWPSGTPRWAEVQGTVQAVAGSWVVVRTEEDGKLVLVDLSGVRLGELSFKPGSPISVYGTPGDSKFQAMGVVLSEKRPAAKPVSVPRPR
jgi:hypothetical protein